MNYADIGGPSRYFKVLQLPLILFFNVYLLLPHSMGYSSVAGFFISSSHYGNRFYGVEKNAFFRLLYETMFKIIGSFIRLNILLVNPDGKGAVETSMFLWGKKYAFSLFLSCKHPCTWFRQTAKGISGRTFYIHLVKDFVWVFPKVDTIIRLSKGV